MCSLQNKQYVFFNNSLTYYYKAFNERSVLNAAILCMATS